MLTCLLQNHYLEKLLPCYRKCTEDELKICPGNWKYGSFFTTIMTECRIWQPWAMKKYVSEQRVLSVNSNSNVFLQI